VVERRDTHGDGELKSARVPEESDSHQDRLFECAWAAGSGHITQSEVIMQMTLWHGRGKSARR
jgi:hypothetical protein